MRSRSRGIWSRPVAAGRSLYGRSEWFGSWVRNGRAGHWFLSGYGYGRSLVPGCHTLGSHILSKGGPMRGYPPLLLVSF
jgi:hypothetical protein